MERQRDMSITFSEDDLRPYRSRLAIAADRAQSSGTNRTSGEIANGRRSVMDKIMKKEAEQNVFREQFRVKEAQREQELEDFGRRVYRTISPSQRADSRKGQRSSSSAPERRSHSVQKTRKESEFPTKSKRYSDEKYFHWESDNEAEDVGMNNTEHHDPSSGDHNATCLLCKWAREYEEKERRKREVAVSTRESIYCAQVKRYINRRQEWEDEFAQEEEKKTK